MEGSVHMRAEYQGSVRTSLVPIPGASVTATMGDRKAVTTTDERGRYAFPDLADGIWTLDIEMLGFAKLTRQVGIALDAASPEWELKFRPPGDMDFPAPPSPPPTAAAPT